jgi:biopolymer transport protein ExbD
MNKKSLPEINASSTADLAFILLVFFLIATTIQTESGILVKLPPDIGDTPPAEIHDRNVFQVRINNQDELLVEDEYLPLNDLQGKLIFYAQNTGMNPSLPEFKSIHTADFGTIQSSKMVISFQCDRQTSYDFYIQVRDEMHRAIRILRDEEAMKSFGIGYNELKTTDAGKAKHIKRIWTLPISEAEPYVAQNQ